MKLLHTSDWHLGQNFYTKSRKDEHAQFLAWLLQAVQQNAVDCVVVAGDVFDTGAPPSYAREMYNQFVVDLHATGCGLVVLGGNHDSVAMLNESKQLLAQLNTHVVAGVLDESGHQAIPLKRTHGDIGAILCAIPFIRPRDVIKSQANESADEKRLALADAIKQHYSDVYNHALALRQELNVDVPIIATGHLTAMGVTSSDSVREIYIGTLGGFAADGFPPADYIALGHIHRPQKVAKTEHIRYCGSPIHLSFDELGQQKQVLLATFSSAELESVSSVAIPQFQAMHAIKGDLEAIATQIDTLENTPTWLSIEVEAQEYLSDLQQRVQALIGDKPFEVLQLKRARKQRSSIQAAKSQTLSELSPTEVFEKRLATETFESNAEQQRLDRLKQRFDAILNTVSDAEPEAKS